MAPVYLRKRVRKPACCMDAEGGVGDETMVVIKVTAVPPRKDAVPSATADTAPTQRDRHLQDIATKGRSGWQAARKYNRRALVEAQIGRYKAVISDALRSHTVDAQATEVAIGVHVLNRMLDFGRPESVRVR